MRLIHTSDWHLGQSLHGHDRQAEHAAFLEGLLATLVQRQPDALLIAGDIFDSANPSAQAQRLYYGFLAAAVAQLPTLQIVVIAGNHDSPSRIDAPQALLAALRVHVVGHYRRVETAPERVCVGLRRANGEIGAWVLALPFLRPGDLADADAATYGEGIAATYREVMAAAQALRKPAQALIAMGHLHVQGGEVSTQSERRLLIGGEEAVAAAMFPAELAYVALGHLHLAQSIGEPRIRYSGSPLPLAFSEIGYPHQIVEITLDGARLAAVESIRVPRPALLLRIPEQHRPLAEVIALLQALDVPTAAPGLEPLIEVLVERAWGDPDPAPLVRAALAGKSVRLAAVKVRRPAPVDADPVASVARPLSIDELKPLALFERLLREHPGVNADAALLRAFGELLSAAEAGER